MVFSLVARIVFISKCLGFGGVVLVVDMVLQRFIVSTKYYFKGPFEFYIAHTIFFEDLSMIKCDHLTYVGKI